MLMSLNNWFKIQVLKRHRSRVQRKLVATYSNNGRSLDFEERQKNLTSRLKEIEKEIARLSK